VRERATVDENRSSVTVCVGIVAIETLWVIVVEVDGIDSIGVSPISIVVDVPIFISTSIPVMKSPVETSGYADEHGQ
jgi:hypothetical protein